MTTWHEYAELEDIEVGKAEMQMACTDETMLYIAGIEPDTGNIVVLIFKKPDDIHGSDELKSKLDFDGIANLLDDAKGQIIFGHQTEYSIPARIRRENIVRAIKDELEFGSNLGLAMRLAAISQYPEYQDINKAHELAVDVPKTMKFLRSKHAENRVINYSDVSQDPEPGLEI